MPKNTSHCRGRKEEHAAPEYASRCGRERELGRLGAPDDVAAAYCSLVSDAASFINSVVLAVDGGLVIGT